MLAVQCVHDATLRETRLAYGDKIRDTYAPGELENPRTTVARHTFCATFARAKGALLAGTTERRAKRDRADLNILASLEYYPLERVSHLRFKVKRQSTIQILSIADGRKEGNLVPPGQGERDIRSDSKAR